MIEKRKKKIERDLRLVNQTLTPHFLVYLLGKTPNLNKVFLLVGLSYFWLWSSNEEFLYKGNITFLEEMLSKFSQISCFCFGYNLAITHPK